MGMYDSVMVNCPKCGTLVELQSKAGKCKMEKYSVYEVPPEIAIDIDGHSESCNNCGTHVVIRMPFKIASVCMIVDNN
jgi:endogenous inhibitor of DNA gyrase (YacG/DUF329 family)